MTFLKFLLRMWDEQKKSFAGLVMMMTVIAVAQTAKIILILPLIQFFTVGQGANTARDLGLVGRLVNKMKIFFESFGIEFSIGLVLSLMIGVYLFEAIFKILLMNLQVKLRLKYTHALLKNLYKSFLFASWSFFVNNKPGKLANILSIEIMRAGMAFIHLCQTVSSVLIALITMILALLISWKLTIFMLIMLPILYILFRRLAFNTGKYGVETTRVNNELQAEAIENILAAKMIKSSSSENKSMGLIDKIIKEVNHYYYLSQKNLAMVSNLQEPVGIIVLSLAIYIGLRYFGQDSQIVILTLVVFFKVTPQFYQIQNNYQQTLAFIPALDEIDRMMALTHKLKEHSGETVFTELKKGVEFKNVSFSYQKGSPVLKNISISIPKGKVIGIVGESGTGKSTIADMLVGLIHPDEGQVLIDGVPLRDFNIFSWRNALGYVTQEMNLFHSTVKENLIWNKPDATEEEIIKAAKLSNAHEFIMNIPEGYDTVIGDRGYRLSGGQRQRLALARIILSDPQIFIFDEATSSLDSESERKIQQSIDALSKTRTTLIIAHRIATLKKVDRIYVFDRGRITESGSWDELIKSNGMFKHIVGMQNFDT